MSSRLNDIQKWVKLGFAQPPANCRFLLQKLQESQKSENALREAYDNLRLEYNLLRQKQGKSEYMVW